MTPRRGVLAGLALVAALALPGCSLRGTAVVTTDDRVTVDAVLQQSDAEATASGSACDTLTSSGLGLAVTPLPGPGLVRCRVRGDVSLTALALFGFGPTLRHTGDGRYVLLAPAALFAGAAPDSQLDVSVTFPGAVVDADPAAQLDGSVVRWTAWPANEGLRAVGLEGGGLPTPLTLGLLGGGGLLLGLASSVVLQSLRAGLRRRSPGVADDEPDVPPAAPVTGGADEESWASDADR